MTKNNQRGHMIVFYMFKQKAVHAPLYVLRKNGEQEENVTDKELAAALKLQKRSPRCSYTQSARFIRKVTCAQKPPESSTRPRRMLSTTPQTDVYADDSGSCFGPPNQPSAGRSPGGATALQSH